MQLSGAAQKILFRLLEVMAETVYENQRNEHVLRKLLDELNAASISAERLEAIEQELINMRHDAVRELVSERLLADESFQIFQSLLTDCHQQISLQQKA